MPAPTTADRVIDLIRTHRRLSRTELVDLTGLTGASITRAVRDLAESGLVHEVGRTRAAIGSPRRLLELDARARSAVGVQLERCVSTVVVTDFTGRTLASTSLRGVGSASPTSTLETLADHIDGLLESTAVDRSRVTGVGLVTHGPQDRGRGVILTPQPTPAWRDFPLTTTLSDRLGLPVLLENDATAAAIGEQWLGGLGTATFGVLYVASGIGGGVVVEESAYRGGTSNAVEIGHVTVSSEPAPEPCSCGNVGCAESLAGPAATVRAATDVPGLARRAGLTLLPDDTLADFERIVRTAMRGDGGALQILERSAAHLATATVTLMNLFDLDTVVLSGPAFATAGPLYAAAAQRRADRGALARLLRPVHVGIAREVRTSAAVGGALTALRSPLVRQRPSATPVADLVPVTGPEPAPWTPARRP